jgi:hypothetical protein
LALEIEKQMLGRSILLLQQFLQSRKWRVVWRLVEEVTIVARAPQGKFVEMADATPAHPENTIAHETQGLTLKPVKTRSSAIPRDASILA